VNANDAVLLASIVVPLVLASFVAYVFLRGWKDDPDELRWKRLAEERKAAQAGEPDSGPNASSDS
jgi:hypothetical protein